MKRLVIYNPIDEGFWKLSATCRQELTQQFHNFFEVDYVLETKGARKKLLDADYIVGMPFSLRMVQKNDKLKAVHFWTAQIPVSWQEVQKFQVTSSSGVNSRSVAEHALYLVMKAIRGEIAPSEFCEEGYFIADNPQQKIAGILGGGHIGTEIFKLTQNLFGEIICCSRSKIDFTTYYDLDHYQNFLEKVDYLFIAVPLSQETRDLFTQDKFFKKIKKDICVVNIARGELFDTQELENFFEKNETAVYLTDVTYPEPYPKEGKLNELENVSITPHLGGRRKDMWELLLKQTFKITKKWL